MTASIPIARTARLLLDGGVIAYPTEGVYGIGCIPAYGEAVERIFAIKGRRADAGLILVAPAIEYFSPWIAPAPEELDRLFRPTDYPTTWIVTARADCPAWLTGGRMTLAVRLTEHPVVAALVAASGSALVSTSANRSGRPPARSALQARRFLGDCLDAVVGGPLGNATGPSEIRVALDDRLIRPRPSK